MEDDVKTIVKENQMTRDDDGVTKAMYSDKEYYSCVVLSESGKTVYLHFYQ